MDIKSLIERKGRYSKEEIAFIIDEGKKWGVVPPKKTNCVNCWRDMAIEIAYNMRPKKKGRRLKGDLGVHGVVFMGRTITDDDLDDKETTEWMEANGFPKYLIINED